MSITKSETSLKCVCGGVINLVEKQLTREKVYVDIVCSKCDNPIANFSINKKTIKVDVTQHKRVQSDGCSVSYYKCNCGFGMLLDYYNYCPKCGTRLDWTGSHI